MKPSTQTFWQVHQKLNTDVFLGSSRSFGDDLHHLRSVCAVNMVLCSQFGFRHWTDNKDQTGTTWRVYLAVCSQVACSTLPFA